MNWAWQMLIANWIKLGLGYGLQSLLIILVCTTSPVFADNQASNKPIQLAVLAFELHDLTLLPATLAELTRTQTAQTILANALQTVGYQLIKVDPNLQNQANRGVGYLLDHPDKTAELGKTLGADYVLVGRVHKPSFLFAYLMVQVVEVNTGKLLADLKVEAKGENIEASRRALLQIATQVQETLPQTVNQPATAEIFTAPTYQQTTQKDFDTAIEDLLFAISQHNFRLTERSNIGQAIAEREEKAFPKVTVLHICNLTYAQALLEKQIASPLHMPCRISIREENGKLVIETLLLPNNAAQQALVDEINQILKDIVNTGAA